MFKAARKFYGKQNRVQFFQKNVYVEFSCASY